MAEPSAESLAQTQRAQAELIDAGFHPVRLAGPVRLLRRLVWPFVRPFHFHMLDRIAAADAAVARLESEVGRLSGLAMQPARLHALDAKLIALEVRTDRAEARADAAAGDINRLDGIRQVSASDLARLEALEAGIHALRDARRPAREAEVARLDRMEKRLDGLEIWADGQRHHATHMETSRNDDVARMVTLHTRLRSDLLAIGNRHVWVEERAEAAQQEAKQLRDDVLPRLARLEEGGTERAAHMSELQDQLRPLREGLFLTATQEGVFLLKAGELISESARRDGVWDPHIVHVAARAAEVVRGRSATDTTLLGIDVGAHFGLISVAMAKLFDRVLSFEPNVFNATLLRANILINGLDGRVEVRREALAAGEGSVSLAPSDRQEIPLPLDDQGRFAPGTASNLGAYSFVADGTGLSQAEAIPLDKLALDGVAFIKIDAQGGDGTVLLGAMQTVARCRPWVIFERERMLAQPFGVAFDEIETCFTGIDYRLMVLHRYNAKQVDYLAIPQEEAASFPEGEAG